MSTDTSFLRASSDLLRLGQKALTKEERKKRQRALDDIGVPSFKEFVQEKTENKIGESVMHLTFLCGLL